MTPRARVLLAMDRPGLLAFVTARIRAGRDPRLDALVSYVGGARADRGIPAEWVPALVMRRYPGVRYHDYARACQRNDLEQVRWAAVRVHIGGMSDPLDLTPDAAVQLSALIDSWSSTPSITEAPAIDAADMVPILPDALGVGAS